MNLKKYFTKRTVSTDIRANSKEGIIEELVDLLCSADKIDRNDSKEAIDALLKREKKMSTGMQNGIAIPHAKAGIVSDLVAVMGIKAEGIDFGSIDGKPSNIFIMALSPEDTPVPHVQFLAEVSQRLSDEDLRRRMLECRTPEELISTFFELKKRW